MWFADTVPPVVFDSSFMAGCDVYLPCNGTAAFTAAPGLYIVRAGETTRKALLK